MAEEISLSTFESCPSYKACCCFILNCAEVIFPWFLFKIFKGNEIAKPYIIWRIAASLIILASYAYIRLCKRFLISKIVVCILQLRMSNLYIRPVVFSNLYKFLFRRYLFFYEIGQIIIKDGKYKSAVASSQQ